MATLISAAERKNLYTRIYHQLGYPVREVQITDEQMDTLFCNTLEDYSKYINEWLVDQQWSTLSGLDIADADFSVAFATKDLNFVKSFSYAYSRQVGLGTNAPGATGWELKKDFIVLSSNTQTYIIPKNREVNEVLWHTPSFTAYDGYGGGLGYDATGGGFGFEALGAGWSYNGVGAGYIQPAYSTMLASSDRAMKSKLIKSEMSYRITGLADGRKLLHLYPVPGGKYQPYGITNYFAPIIDGTYVWYWYYDTNSSNVNKCLKDNPDIAVVTRPTDVPIDNLSWNKLNAPAKTWVRQYLLALAKSLLGYIRGTYSGSINITDAQVTMDYSYLLQEGKDEKEKLQSDLVERLNNLTYAKQLELRATESEMLNKTLSYVPLGISTH